MIKLLTIKICFLILFALITATNAAAQKFKFIETPIRFSAGNNSMTFTGTVTDRVRPIYTFRARKGQTIRARITSKDDKAFFMVFTRAQIGIDDEDLPSDWTFTFDKTDSYEIVLMTNEQAAKYKLEVTLK